MSGYTIAADGRSITCHRCGRTSHNPRDVHQRYCGWCHWHHEDEEPNLAGPSYWVHESSGRLRLAVAAYLLRQLSEEDIALLRAYLRQWIMHPAWDANPFLDVIAERRLRTLRNSVDALTSRETIEDWMAEADEIGMDPL